MWTGYNLSRRCRWKPTTSTAAMPSLLRSRAGGAPSTRRLPKRTWLMPVLWVKCEEPRVLGAYQPRVSRSWIIAADMKLYKERR
jgi:hypothetical protein